MTTLIEYSREIGPKIRKLLELNEALKEWKAEDKTVQGYLEDIKEARASLKSYVEDTESGLIREINDLNTDIKLAIKAAAKGTNYKPAELKSFMVARAKESVEKVVGKGELFAELDKELA